MKSVKEQNKLNYLLIILYQIIFCLYIKSAHLKHMTNINCKLTIVFKVIALCFMHRSSVDQD